MKFFMFPLLEMRYPWWLRLMVEKRNFKTLATPSDKYHELCRLCKTTGKRDVYED